MTLAPNFATEITGVAVTGGIVNDTGSKFAAGVNDTGRKLHRDQQHHRQISNNKNCLHLKGTVA